jgi:hypothetical protein
LTAPSAGYGAAMRVMFTTYLLLIVAGLVFASIVGLGHH